MRGIRGAITIEHNTKEEIFAAVRFMVSTACRMNDVTADMIGAILFSATEDVTAAFPAAGARQIPGFELVPLFDARQMAVEDSLKLCIRALILCDSDKSQREIHHVYLRGAANLRPDLIDPEKRAQYEMHDNHEKS